MDCEFIQGEIERGVRRTLNFAGRLATEDDTTVMLFQVDGGSITVEEVHRDGYPVAMSGNFEMVEGNFAPVIWCQP